MRKTMLRMGASGAVLGLIALASIARADDPPKPVTPSAKPAESKPDRSLVMKLKQAVIHAATAEKPEARAQAQAELEAAPRIERGWALAESLNYGQAPVRIYAARTLARLHEKGATGALVAAVVKEADKKVRAEEYRALKSFEAGATADDPAPETAVLFMQHLRSVSPETRVRAVTSLALFRDRRSVPVLVEYMTDRASGFGQSAIDFTVERAVISGWHVVSGGTGNSVVEVAEPMTEIIKTGTAEEMKVRQVEISYAVAVLQDLTGASIGPDPVAWQRFVSDTPGFQLANPK